MTAFTVLFHPLYKEYIEFYLAMRRVTSVNRNSIFMYLFSVDFAKYLYECCNEFKLFLYNDIVVRSLLFIPIMSVVNDKMIEAVNNTSVIKYGGGKVKIKYDVVVDDIRFIFNTKDIVNKSVSARGV